MTFMIRLSFWKVELGPGYKYGFEINSLFLHQKTTAIIPAQLFQT